MDAQTVGALGETLVLCKLMFRGWLPSNVNSVIHNAKNLMLLPSRKIDRSRFRSRLLVQIQTVISSLVVGQVPLCSIGIWVVRKQGLFALSFSCLKRRSNLLAGKHQEILLQGFQRSGLNI